MIWEWVKKIIPLVSGDPNQTCHLSLAQALIGDPLDCSPPILEKWWAALRFPALWFIWLARIAETILISSRKEAPTVTQRKIWHRTRLYLKAGWKKRKAQVLRGSLSKDEAKYHFGFDYGQNDALFRVGNMELWVVDYPLEPD